MEHDENGDFSVDKFWKLKKCVLSNREEKNSVITRKGIEVFDIDAILNEYVVEFKERLSHRKINENLESYQETTHQLLKVILEQAAQNPNKTDFTVAEVYDSIMSFMSGKSAGHDKHPPDVFRHSGYNLLIAIKNVLNQIKNSMEIPESWANVIIVTLYKNKGSRKMLQYYRGIFLTAFLSKVMEKMVKNRVNEKLLSINPLQGGGRQNKSPPDSLFIVRSFINHANYLKSPLYITLYDYQTCFDSLWLEDCLVSLWQLGIDDEMLPLIYKLNENCRVTIKTPYGNTEPFECPRIVKQGTVLGGSLCGSTTAELCSDLKLGGASLLDEKIGVVLFVDDTTTLNVTFNDVLKCHQIVVHFSNKKRLKLNVPKCVMLVVNGKDYYPTPELFVGDEEIECVDFSKYLGDMLAANGSNNELILDRVKKAKAVIISILSLCSAINLGHHCFKVLLLLYSVVFLASVLFNAQTWTNLTKTQVNQLQTVQLKFLKRMVKTPNSTPNAFTFLELGVLPIEYEIHKRQLVFLHHILTLPKSDPVYKLYEKQKLLKYEKNWANNISSLLLTYSLDSEDVASMSKITWKNKVTSSITSCALKSLQETCLNQTKTYMHTYETFMQQQYITAYPPHIASFLFKLRGRVLNCRDNHHSANKSIMCRLCAVNIESQDHILNCSFVRGNNPIIHLTPYFSDAVPLDRLKELIVLVDRYTNFQELVSKSPPESTARSPED